MKNKHLVCIFVVGMFLLSRSASADTTSLNPMLERVKNESWFVRAPWRLIHGVVNAGLGWTQLIVEPIHSVRHEAQNIAEGISDGIGGTVYYTLIGVWDIATFWVPGKYGKDIAVTDCVMKEIRPAQCCKRAEEASL